MARLNVAAPDVRYTHEGAAAVRVTAAEQLRRLVMANMLWEDQFYVDGAEVAERIAELIPLVPATAVADIAYEARTKMKLRHVPLLLARELARHPDPKARLVVSGLLPAIIQRPDELTEFLAIYWREKRQPLSAQVKKGLAQAIGKFDEYALAKWQHADAAIKLRDVLFLVHAKPTKEREELYKRIAEQTLATPDTWEVALSASAGENKRAVWEQLLAEGKLGALALLRNLRNMQQAGVPEPAITAALAAMKTERVLPFRFISAAKHAPQLEPELEVAMFRSLEGAERLKGRTVLLVDVSGSMAREVSGKSDLQRIDAAAGLAMLLREVCDQIQILIFRDDCRSIPPRRGFALRDAIGKAAGGTRIGVAVLMAQTLGYDRVIVLTDEQSADEVNAPLAGTHAYMINVGAYQNGIGYGAWMRISGWSEAIVAFILAAEA